LPDVNCQSDFIKNINQKKMIMKTNNLKFLKFTAILVMVAVSLISCEKEQEEPKPTKDIVEIAQENSSLSTFVAIVTEAGLASSLKGAGPFYCFRTYQ
jgi:uncharacterized surface protein with fasciclin (FAS1) repeats